MISDFGFFFDRVVASHSSFPDGFFGKMNVGIKKWRAKRRPRSRRSGIVRSVVRVPGRAVLSGNTDTDMTELSRTAAFGPDLAGPILVEGGTEARLSIAEMAETFGVTLRALRFYEEKGLLRPERKGARRFYGAREIGRMRVILQAKRIGLTLVEIREVISLLEGRSSRMSQLRSLREMCAKQEDLLREQLEQLQAQAKETTSVVAALEGLIEANPDA